MEDCAICLEFGEFQFCMLYYCHHVFHRHCLQRWSKDGITVTCPLCRALSVSIWVEVETEVFIEEPLYPPPNEVIYLE
ncbi:hypothetical protein B4U80_14757 [Leptotrombidium deliense]|uniref:RING-type domain-containing protein n=1 Tax=Leptotrombidium deliense TaxID=299467 RepID=A0A443QKG8_9ACAR|nr:hypothetical protein B4U80_14757 [Leptotrombidium deliense]